MNLLLGSLRPSRRTLFDAAAVMVMTLAALYAFRSSYGGTQFLIDGGVAALVGLVVAYIGHTLRWPLLATVAIGGIAYVALASSLALRDRGFGGKVPSHESALAALTKPVTGWKELITTAPPVGNTGGLLVLPIFLGAVSGFVSYLLAQRPRLRQAAVVVPFVVLGLAIATGIDEPVSVLVNGAVLTGAAVAWLALGEHRQRPLMTAARFPVRRMLSATVVVAVAGLAGLGLGGRMPLAEANQRTIWRQTVVPPFDPRVYPSPLAAYRAFVKSGAPSTAESRRVDAPVVFTVEGLPEGVPVRLATMDAYDGLVWQVSAGDPADPSLYASGSFERVGASLPSDFEGEMATVTVTIGLYNDVWIPDVGEVESMRFTGSSGGPERDRELSESFRYNRATDTAATPLRLQEGDRYEMRVRLPHLVESTAGVVLIPAIERLGTVAPFATGPIVEKLNTPELQSMSTANERLDKVASSMRTYGAYSDGDVSLGQIRARAGHSARRLADFVDSLPNQPLVGNAEQYASAYALLFRALDQLPTRVVMGFKPSKASLDEPVDVLATEVDAWVEVPAENVGWLMIEPTPKRDQTKMATVDAAQSQPDYRTQNPPPPPLVDPEFEQPATTKGKAKATKQATPPDVVAPAPETRSLGDIVSDPVVITGTVVASPFVLAALAAALIMAIKALRRRRRRRRGERHQRIANGWREVTDLALDLGRTVPSSTTRREAAVLASERTQPLAERADAAIWGGAALTDADVDEYWRELVATLKSMRSEVGLVSRLRARASLQSLRRRESGARAKS